MRFGVERRQVKRPWLDSFRFEQKFKFSIQSVQPWLPNTPRLPPNGRIKWAILNRGKLNNSPTLLPSGGYDNFQFKILPMNGTQQHQWDPREKFSYNINKVEFFQSNRLPARHHSSIHQLRLELVTNCSHHLPLLVVIYSYSYFQSQSMLFDCRFVCCLCLCTAQTAVITNSYKFLSLLWTRLQYSDINTRPMMPIPAVVDLHDIYSYQFQSRQTVSSFHYTLFHLVS